MTSPEHATDPARKRLLILVGTLLLCACGQTGPLYLPEDAPEQQTSGDGEQETSLTHDDQH